jgi:hypothetical protein
MDGGAGAFVVEAFYICPLDVYHLTAYLITLL